MDQSRQSQTIVLNWSELKSAESRLDDSRIEVVDVATSKKHVSQTIDLDGDGLTDQLVFQADFVARDRKTFQIRNSREEKSKETQSNLFCAQIPERQDDFAWENDRIGFRMYSKTLEWETVSSGIDVMAKRVESPVLKKWLSTKDFDYHTDTGEGCDFYKVGPSRGCGGLSIWDGKQMRGSRNFIDSRVIVSGPVRLVFELTYAPWDAGGYQVSETKRITLDAGSQLNRFESYFKTDIDKKEIEVVVGIVKRPGEGGGAASDPETGWLSYWEPETSGNGHLGCAVVMHPHKVQKILENDDHHFIVAKDEMAKPIVYYAGAGWSRWGFPTRANWEAYVEHFAKKMLSPLEIKIL